MTDTTIEEPVPGPRDDDVDESWDESWDDEGEYVYIPKEMGMLRKAAVILASFAVIVVAVLGAGGWWVISQVRGSERGVEELTVSVPSGSTMAQVARILEDKGVVKSATFFRYYAKWKGLDSVKAGDYDGLYTGMALDDVIQRLEGNPIPQKFIDVTFPEGMRVSGWPTPERYTSMPLGTKILNSFPDMNAEELNHQLAVVFPATQTVFHQPGQPLEGFLFPATYRVQKSELGDEAALIKQMLDKFDDVAREVGLHEASTKLSGVAGRTPIGPYEALIVASLVEKEAKVAEDRPKIARVIYNRLLRSMSLEIDASVYYCLPVERAGTPLTASDLRIDCPYNTRRKSGLPPTPIANPGKASLEAALNPEEGDWLFYVVADKEGRHFFTNDYNEFLRARKAAQDQGLL